MEMFISTSLLRNMYLQYLFYLFCTGSLYCKKLVKMELMSSYTHVWNLQKSLIFFA